MISKIVYPDGRDYLCDDCRKAVEKFKNHKSAIAAKWAISRNRKKCYCPKCAPAHRYTGRRGASSSIPQPD